MKKVLFCLLSGMLLVFGSCQSDEPTANPTGDPTTSNDRAVKFTVGGTSPAVRTHYDANGNINWSHNDAIRIISPAFDESAHQNAHYAISKGGGSASGEFTPTEDHIYWNEEGENQHFYAYYPAESSGITDIDHVTGAANFHVPADQSLTADIRPSLPEHENTHPLAYAIAATKGVTVPVGEGNSVGLEFHDFMNVLRIRVENPSEQPFKGIKVSTTTTEDEDPDNDLYLAGTVRVTPPNDHPDYTLGEPADNDHFDFVNTGESTITVELAEVSIVSEFEYDLYLLPQDYDGGTLKVTIMIGEDESEVNDLSRVISTDFNQGSIKNLSTKIDRVYMGTMDEGPLYIAVGNLIATYSDLSAPAPNGYYIAGSTLDKSLYVPNDDHSISTLLSPDNFERDLFKLGEINDPNYWANDNTLPEHGDFDNKATHTGEPDYDLATRLNSNGFSTWRTPTENEWNIIANTKTNYYSWAPASNYKGSGVNGYLVSTIPGTTPGTTGLPVASIFLPAAGIGSSSSTATPIAISDRGVICNYWTSTHTNNGEIILRFGETGKIGVGQNIYNNMDGSWCLAIRPITNSPQ